MGQNNEAPDRRHLQLHRDDHNPEELNPHTPEGRARRAELYRDVDIDELLAMLATRSVRFVGLVKANAPAPILETERILVREVAEALLSRGAGRSRPRE